MATFSLYLWQINFMGRYFIFNFLLFILQVSHAQPIHEAHNMQPDKDFDNILSKKLTDDSLATAFVIWIKDTVATHKHLQHSEHIYVLEGSGSFYLNDVQTEIQPGSFFLIPKNSWHAVKVKPNQIMKVLSIQSPGFDGTDRIFKDPPPKK